MNALRKLQQLQGELAEAGITATLTLTPEGVKVSAKTVTDRYLAIAELKKRGVKVAP